MHIISSSFSCSVNNATSYVLKITDLQSGTLVEHVKPLALLGFYYSLKVENFPNMSGNAQKMKVLYGSSFICEQTFSVKCNKSRYRCTLTDNPVDNPSYIHVRHSDFIVLVQAQYKLDFSH